MGQSLFKKHSKFKNFDEILPDLGTLNQVFLDNIKTQKTILKSKNMGQNRYRKHSKFQKFQVRNFTLTWSNEGK